MTEDQFKALCNTYGFAPSRALREMLDTATAQAVLIHKESASRWRNEAYRLGGTPLPWSPDEKLLKQALDALEYHQEQTRPIWRTTEAIEALEERLKEKQ